MPIFKYAPQLVGAAVTLLLAIMGAYLAVDRHVVALAATSLTTLQVEHIVELKTSDKLDAILARQAQVERQLDRLEATIMQLAPAPHAR